MSKISEKIQKIQSELNTSNIRIIAVTKYVGVEEIIEAYEAGIRDFAESKAQDAQKKRETLPKNIEKNIIWHFVGHLQANKVSKVVGNFDYIHSIDSVKLVKLIAESAKSMNLIQKILIQVNIAREETKYGFNTEEIKEVFPEILKLDSIDIVGLMTIAPNTLDEKQLHFVFGELRKLRDQFKENYKCNLSELSMGMSNDYKIAVLEGATMIRTGQALFN